MICDILLNVILDRSMMYRKQKTFFLLWKMVGRDGCWDFFDITFILVDRVSAIVEMRERWLGV